MKTYNSSKNYLLLFIFLLLVPFISSAQHFCGSISKAPSSDLTPSELKLSSQDRFGNIYTQSELALLKNRASPLKTPTNTGYFEVNFSSSFPETIDVSGHPNFGEDIRPVICQVFADLSEIILQREHVLSCGDVVPQQSVNILVRTDVCGSNPDCDAATTQIAGSASPLYSFSDQFKLNDPCFPVTESLIWKKINTEEVVFPLGFDGILNINVENTNFDYHLDYDNPVDTDKLDLYSVVLHEVLHIMGFASRIDLTGEPINSQFSTTNYYSRFDQFLHLTNAFIPDGGSQNIERLLDGDCGKNCFTLNSSVSDFDELVNTSCNSGDKDIVFGESGIAAIYGGNGNELDLVNGLSHLREDCEGTDANYVMDPFIQNGDDSRTISIEELNILCKLGYLINSAEELDCQDCFAYASTDQASGSAEQTIDYYQSCCYTPLLAKQYGTLIFDVDELLCNDLHSGGAEVTEVYWDTQFWGGATLENIADNVYQFTATTGTIHRVYYTIRDCNCYVSTAFFDIIVSDELPECTNTKCSNLICIGDFENISKTNDFYFEACKEDLFFMDNANQNTPDICEVGNNQFLSLVNIIGAEATLIPLDHPIQPGCTMEITMDIVSRAESPPGKLNIYGSYEKPCTPNEVFIKRECNSSSTIVVDNICTNKNYTPYCLLTNEIITNTGSGGLAICPSDALPFENRSWSIKNDFEEEIRYIVIYNDEQPSVMWLDNLDIRSVCPPEIIETVEDVEFEEGQSVLVDIEICFSDEAYEGFEPEFVEIYTQLPSGLSYAPGGDFTNGYISLSDLDVSECRSLQMAIQSTTPGEYLIELDATVIDLCLLHEFDINVTVKELVGTGEIELESLPENAELFLVNVLGERIPIPRALSTEELIAEQKSNQLPGIYFIVAVEGNNNLGYKKVIL